jgi:adenylylsulfate kinase-like enzyme
MEDGDVDDVGVMPVLWLYGPPGVGKTTVGWALYGQFVQGGTAAGYVDIDQVGMCYAAPTPRDWAPEPADDPGRHRLKARSLNAVLPNFRAAGAQCVIVSGVVDAERGIHVDLIPNGDVTPCRLRADAAELRARIASRGGPSEYVGASLREADALDRNDIQGACVDTTGLGAADVVALVRKRIGAWPVETASVGTPGTDRGEPTGPILWIYGATAVGKSTVGWEVYQRLRQAGVRAAYIDLAQLGFHRPARTDDAANHLLKASNLAAVWRTYHAVGAQCVVIVGPVDRARTAQLYRKALPRTEFSLYWLHASRAAITERVMLRGHGQSPTWGLAGDELTSQSADRVQRVGQRAVTEAEELEQADVGGVPIDTDGRAPSDLAEAIVGRWLARL